MLLLPQEEVDRLKRDSAKAVLTIPNKSVMERHEEELHSLLNTSENWSDDEKIRKYSEVLRKIISVVHYNSLFSERNQVRTVGIQPSSDAISTDASSDNVVNEDIAVVVEKTPAAELSLTEISNILPHKVLVSADKEKLLRAHLKMNTQTFAKGPDGELMISGTLLPNTNMEELILDFSNAHKWNARPPVGSSRFAKYLNQTGFSTDYIANKSRRPIEPTTSTDTFAVQTWSVS